jgi:hypothetical protein
MNRFANSSLMIISALALAALTACGLPGQSTGTGAGNPPPATTVETTPTGVGGPVGVAVEASAEAVDPASLCPAAGEGQALLINEKYGYCFLYPASYTSPADAGQRPRTDSIIGQPLQNANRPQSESPAIYLSISYAGADDGTLTARQYAERTLNATRDPSYEQPPTTLEDISIGGQPASLMRGVPGMFGGQEGFVIAGGQRYRMYLSPEIGMVPDLDAEAQASWGMVSTSIVFFPPSEPFTPVMPADVCPPATAETRQIIAEGDGYCYLSPADSQTHPLFPDGVIIGPLLPNADFPDLHVSLVLGTFGAYPVGTSPREAAPGLLDTFDPASISETSIGGFPAITGIPSGNGSPFGHRVAVLVNADGTAYTITMNPYDAAMYPSSISDGDRLWDSVINSLAFFTPWK